MRKDASPPGLVIVLRDAPAGTLPDGNGPVHRFARADYESASRLPSCRLVMTFLGALR